MYRAVHPDTRDRLIFVSAQAPDDDAAFTVLNDPVADGDLIQDLVEQGYLVRTRTDADTAEARTGDTTRREAAFASGAQIVSTDYEREDPRFPGFVVDAPRRRPRAVQPGQRAPRLRRRAVRGRLRLRRRRRPRGARR